MSLHLFKHNQTAYEAAVSMMDREGKAAVIHPTGTGKSFVAFKLADEHPHARICWLAPSEYIYQTQLENVKKTLVPGEMLHTENITFFSYSKLLKMMQEEEKRISEGHSDASVRDASGETEPFDPEKLHPDYIVLDEFHRCGAPEWGKSVQKLLDMYPKAKLLGLSATNVRYLDSQRDMAQEIFDGHIASEMTLGEAIARGSWLQGIKYGRSGKRMRVETLSREQLRQLNELGITWEKNNVMLWNTKFELAREYYEEHGNLDVPVAYCVEGVKLGRWISNIRGKRRNPKSSGMILDESRIRQLDSIRMNWK